MAKDSAAIRVEITESPGLYWLRKVGKSLDQTAGVKHCGMPKGKQNRESCQRSLLTLSETYHRAGAYPRAQIAEACGFRSYLFGLGTKNNVSIREDVLKDHPVLRQ